METTIKKLEPQTYQGKPNGFKVTLADGTEGYLQKESDDGLKEGEAVIADVKDYTSKKGVHSNLVTLKRRTSAPQSQTQQIGIVPPLRPTINVGAGKSKEELKVEATIRVAEVVIKGFCEGKLESAQVSVHVKEFGQLLGTEIDDIFGGK
jgi:hypothetical protein